MGGRCGCDGERRWGPRNLLLLALGGLVACGAEPEAPATADPEAVLRAEVEALRAAGPSEGVATGADPSALLTLGDALVVALRGEDAVVLTDGARELTRAAAPGAVQALVPTEGGFVAAGAHANVLQRYVHAEAELVPSTRIALPGAQGIGALAGGGDVVYASEAFGRAVFRVALGAVPEIRRGEGCREARGLALAGERLVMACADGYLVAFDAATLAPVARTHLPGPLLALAAWEENGLRVATSGVGADGSEGGDAATTQSVLRLHALDDDGWRSLDTQASADAEEARVLLRDGATLRLFGFARGLRRTLRVTDDRLEPGAPRPWPLGVRAAVATAAGPVTANVIADALVGEDADGNARVTQVFPAGAERLGEVLLRTGLGRDAGAPSCGACHLDGRTDFRHHWCCRNDGTSLSTSLRGRLHTLGGVERLMSLGSAHEGAELAPLGDETTRRAAAARFVARWNLEPDALALAERARTPLEEAGGALFARTCDGCHGRGAPSLDRIARRGPYDDGHSVVHGGAIWLTLDAMLEDVRMEPFAHVGGDGRPLTVAEREALLAFLSIL